MTGFTIVKQFFSLPLPERFVRDIDAVAAASTDEAQQELAVALVENIYIDSLRKEQATTDGRLYPGLPDCIVTYGILTRQQSRRDRFSKAEVCAGFCLEIARGYLRMGFDGDEFYSKKGPIPRHGI